MANLCLPWTKLLFVPYLLCSPLHPFQSPKTLFIINSLGTELVD